MSRRLRVFTRARRSPRLQRGQEGTRVAFLNSRPISKKPFHLLSQRERGRCSAAAPPPLLLQQHYSALQREDGGDSALNHGLHLSNISSPLIITKTGLTDSYKVMGCRLGGTGRSPAQILSSSLNAIQILLWPLQGGGARPQAPSMSFHVQWAGYEVLR